MAVQAGLCRTWSETPKTSFLRTRLIYTVLLILIFNPNFKSLASFCAAQARFCLASSTILKIPFLPKRLKYHLRFLVCNTSSQNQQNDIAPSVDSDQPRHSQNLFRLLVARMAKSGVLAIRKVNPGECQDKSQFLVGAHAFLYFCHDAAHMKKR